MQTIHPREGFFTVTGGTARSQAAAMTLQPSDATGGPDNRHADADQWRFVVFGRGEATVAGRSVALEPVMLLLIEADEVHGVRCPGEAPLRTLNVYAPPAY